ncbi:MAG: 16S rRNA (cytosine(1402)-N(4))-methyltransferase RsmH [Actinomycetales bacterium]|nr:MAG: 16S rRNA (cytosine(1402)-N(4))-methyltransferase RsmH [Actinomycetales bacterium]
MQDALHIPVALDRCIALLSPAIESSTNPVVVDATLGMGGHSRALLLKYPQLKIIALDRDLSAIKVATTNLSDVSERVIIVHAVYDELALVLEKLGISEVDGILFDLGVSSMQLDQADRGFAYSQDAPLDMRMDQSCGPTALDILNTYTYGELVRVIRNYGEEKFATKIADNVIKAREAGTLRTTKDLAEIVKSSIPAPARRTGGNPAKRTFQALRIEVNQELAVLERALPQAINAIGIGGRLIVMSYQSLEDKIVKKALSEVVASHSPLGLPFDLPNSAASYKLVINGSEGATVAEIEINARAQSMRLRALERVAA